MQKEKHLSILQYNIRKQKATTLVPLLADANIQDFDVLAIQEPWRNPHVPTSYNPRDSNFHLICHADEKSRVSFYVNKELDPESWNVRFEHKDLSTLTLGMGSEADKHTINIHNVYNPPPHHMLPLTALLR